MRTLLAPEVRLLCSLEEPGELRRLVALCDWQALAELAVVNRLEGRALRAFAAADAIGAVPRSTRGDWQHRRRRDSTRFRSEVVGQIEDIATELEAARTTGCLLKGTSLVLAGLSAAAERPIGDIDLLVEPTSVAAASTVLTRLGYEQSTDTKRHAWARQSHYHDPRWFHPGHRLPIEVHWHLLRPDHRLAFDVSTIRTVALPLPSGRKLRRLDDADLLAHLCLHFWDDRAAGKPGSLGQMWDIRDAVRRLDPAAWTLLQQRAAKRGHERVLGTVLALAIALLDAPVPAHLTGLHEMSREPEVRDFALRRVCAPRPAPIQLLLPNDDVYFGVGRLLKQAAPWAYRSRSSPLRSWPAVATTRVVSAALRSNRALVDTYGPASPVRLRVAYLRELARLLLTALGNPRWTWRELKLDRWANRVDLPGKRRRERDGRKVHR